jgi:hypothetical protein
LKRRIAWLSEPFQINVHEISQESIGMGETTLRELYLERNNTRERIREYSQ